MSRAERGMGLVERHIVVTRPREQSHRLAQLLREAGGEPVLFPTIEIGEPEHPEKLAAAIEALKRCDLAVFVSPTAVERGLRAVRALGSWPAGPAVAAVGPGGAAALAAAGIENVIVPAQRFDSEGLLHELAGTIWKCVVIFRGGGGRELLADELRQRGAEVILAECYQRVRPETDAGPLLDSWRRGRLDALVVTSSEAMDNLALMLGEAQREFIPAMPIFAPHPRIVERAQWHGARKAVLTGAGDAGIVEGIKSFFAKLEQARH
jgi:uroporphyrinogen-III synthase